MPFYNMNTFETIVFIKKNYKAEIYAKQYMMIFMSDNSNNWAGE